MMQGIISVRRDADCYAVASYLRSIGATKAQIEESSRLIFVEFIESSFEFACRNHHGVARLFIDEK